MFLHLNIYFVTETKATARGLPGTEERQIIWENVQQGRHKMG